MIIATASSVYEYEDKFDEDPKVLFDKTGVRRVIEGEKIRIVAFVDNSIFVDSASGQHLQTGIDDRIDSLCLVKEEPFTLLIGTTPPYLYRYNEKDVSAKRIEEFDNLEVRGEWFTPWGGPAAVRSLASTKDGWIYADIHVGSIMRSNDYGQNWEPVNPTLHKDVHEVSTSPASKTNVYANTFLSVYISEDRGDNWKHKSNKKSRQRQHQK